jgi:hypothetical protein
LIEVTNVYPDGEEQSEAASAFSLTPRCVGMAAGDVGTVRSIAEGSISQGSELTSSGTDAAQPQPFCRRAGE